jgi:hypothetical protein
MSLGYTLDRQIQVSELQRPLRLQLTENYGSMNAMETITSCSDRQEDGSYFIDADSEIFRHVLQFMQRPSKFPLFWTKETSFDYALYNKLEAKADHFVLHDLRDWIQKKLHLGAAKTGLEVKEAAVTAAHVDGTGFRGKVVILFDLSSYPH